MKEEAWRRLDEVLDQVLESEGAEREALLEAIGARDPELRREIQAFLDAETAAEGFLSAPLSAAPIAGAIAAEEGSWDALQLEGRQVGPYRVLRELGRGGMGAVFLAQRADGHFEQQVALKLVRRGMDTADALERFRAERQILAGLHHPHIARLLDGGISDAGQPYFAMEHVAGAPLTRYCDEARLGIDDRLRLFLQVCEAVEHAHRNLVLHRDLKPSNVLVTADGQVKLLDFGIAKGLDPSATGSATVTRREARLATPRYAAPEQLLGGAVTTATDVYSLGVVLYELLAGRHPYGSEPLAPAEIEAAVRRGNPEPPSLAVRRDQPPIAGGAERASRRLRGDLDNVVAMALRVEPERRYASVAALAGDIRRFLAGRAVSAAPDTFSYRASKLIRRHKVWVAAAVLLGLSLAAGLLGTLWQAREALEQARKAEEVRRFVVGLFEDSDPGATKGKDVGSRELLARGVERVETELAGQPALEAELLLLIGNLYHRLGADGDGAPLLEKALALRRGFLGDRHLGVAEAQLALGAAYVSQGDPDRARPLFERALETRRSKLGESHPDTAVARGHLGRLAFQQGDLASAETLLRRAVADQQRGLPPLDAALAVDRSALGRVLHAKGDVAEAEGLHREVLAGRRRFLGEEHTRVAESLHDLARVVADRGDLAEAEALYRQVLVIDRGLLGDDHAAVAGDLDDLGALLASAGSYADAEVLLRDAVKIRQLRGGGLDRALSLHHLAQALRPQGKLPEAETASRRAIATARAMLGDDHPSVSAARDALARTLCDQGELREAEDLARTASESLRRHSPPQPRRLADVLLTLGHVLLKAGRVAEAEVPLREAIRLRRQLFGDEDRRTAEARLELGHCLQALGREAEAEGEIAARHDAVSPSVDGMRSSR